MIKNQLYPYVEKYINEFLWGFTKDQLNVGVMNGIINLDGLNIRVDKVNEKLNDLDVPIWFKAGIIKNIRVGCSLMNFLGEKPLEVNIDEINLILTPSFKWILKNFSSFIEENEFHIKETYDPTDNNSHDIFSRKVNIYDSSSLKQKQKLLELFTDKSKISALINKIFTKCVKFYYQKSYLINIKVSNVHIRFEDDQLINAQGNIGMGLTFKSLELNLAADGIMKNNSFKFENINVYWEPSPKMLIPSKTFTDNLDKDNVINEKYYEYIKTLKLNYNPVEGVMFLINNFNCMGSFGIKVVDSGNLDFFARNKEKNFKFYIQIATSELNLSIYPDILQIFQSTADFMKSFYIIEPIQDFKPMRKPYKNSDLTKKYKKDPGFKFKRKMVVRDWLYYLVWFYRFKNAIYGNVFKNPMQMEFSKYYNICCLPNEEKEKEREKPQLNDSISIKKEKDKSFINESEKKSNIVNEVPQKEKEKEPEDLNPENINLAISLDVLLKGINFSLNPSAKIKSNDCVGIKINPVEIRANISKDKFDFGIEIKNLVLNNKNKLQISRVLEDKIGEEIIQNHSHSRNQNNTDNLYSDKQMNINNIIYSQNDSFSSDINYIKKVEENGNNQQTLNISQSCKSMGLNPYANSKMHSKLMFINETLDQLIGTSRLDSSQDNNSKLTRNITQSKSNLHQANKSFSMVSVLMEESTMSNFEEEKANKSINLSKALNDYNKSIFKPKKQNPISIKQNIIPLAKQSVSKATDLDEVLELNFFEILALRNSNNHSCINFKFSKKNANKVTDSLIVETGTIRVNFLDDILLNVLKVFSDYSAFSRKHKPSEKESHGSTLNSTHHKEVYEMKKFIYDKLIQQNDTSTLPANREKNDYKTYLKNELEHFDKILIENGKFEINYIFNILNRRNLEICLNYDDLYVISFTENGLNKVTMLGKAKLPKLNFRFVHNQNKLIVKIFDLELEYSDTDRLRGMANRMLAIVEEKMKFSFIIFEPVLKKLMEESKKLIPKAVSQSSSKQPTGKQITNGVKNIINNNILKDSNKDNANLLNNNNNLNDDTLSENSIDIDKKKKIEEKLPGELSDSCDDDNNIKQKIASTGGEIKKIQSYNSRIESFANEESNAKKQKKPKNKKII